ncbi:MAG: hypothetical protein E7056_01045 [Lentisphaerae bacterium]|nr:hypothetical protein [Lentisphaerota bacterium]
MRKFCSLMLLASSTLVFGAAAPCPEKPVQIKESSFEGEYLNNLVRKMDCTVQCGADKLTAQFEIVKNDAWVFMEFSAPVKDFALEKDGKVVADSKVLVKSREFMLDLTPGKYSVRAASADPRIKMLEIKRFNRVPEIYYYAPSSAGGMHILDGADYWQQLGDQLLSSTNLIANGGLSREELGIYRSAGRKVFFNTMNKPVSDHKLEVFAANVHSKLGFEFFDGFTVDEFDFANPRGGMGYMDYEKALKLVKNPQNKRMYTWSYSVKYTGKPEQLAFVKLCANPPSGKGRLMTEVYLESKETEAEAKEFIERRVCKDAASILQQLPELAPHYGIVLGNFNAMPILTQEVVPEVDYKYYLDWQMHTIANHPSCKDLGLVGYWGGNYCQEELQRWCLLLLRHYFVEGNKSMLSEKYGYKYRPGILQNGDFLEDLSSWQVFPAEAGSIRQDSVKGHGYLMQCRWGSTKSANGKAYNGDAAAVMVKSDKGINILSQKMVNLIPGKPYVLHYVVGSFDDAKNKVNNPRYYGVEVQLDPAEASIRHSKVFIDQREKHRYHSDKGFSRANLHRVIFVPKTSEVTLNLTDGSSKEKAGTQLMVNFVQVKPYFAPEMMP